MVFDFLAEQDNKYGSYNNEHTPPRNLTNDEYKRWYHEVHLKSAYWFNVTNFVKKRDKYRCRICNTLGSRNNPLHVHHRKYKDYIGRELQNDHCVITLCKECHELFHANRKIVKD